MHPMHPPPAYASGDIYGDDDIDGNGDAAAADDSDIDG